MDHDGIAHYYLENRKLRLIFTLPCYLSQRSSAKKRPATYAESASEDGSDSDADALKPAKKSSLKKPAAKRRKADDDDGDDFIVADDDVSEAEVASGESLS